MPSLLFNKYIWVFAGLLLFIGGVSYTLYNWHYKPLKKRDKMLVIYGTKINNLEVNLTKCRADSVVSEFESFFEGGGGIEESNTSNGNIFLKRVQ